MQSRKISYTQGGQPYVTFYLLEKKGEEVTTDPKNLEKIATLIKSLNLKAKEITLASINKATSATNVVSQSYNIMLQCDNTYFSLHNRVSVPLAQHPMAIRLKNMISDATLIPTIEDIKTPLIIQDYDARLVDALHANTEIVSVALKPSGFVHTVEALGDRVLTAQQVGEILHDTTGSEYIAKQGDIQAVFDKRYLGRLSYYIPLLQRLMNATTGVMLTRSQSDKQKDYDRQVESLKKFLNNKELNALVRGLPDNNIWSTFKTTTVTPLIKTITQHKAALQLDADLRKLLDAMQDRLIKNARQAEHDSDVIQSIKNDFVRSVEQTAALFWSMKKNTTQPGESKDFFDFLSAFNANVIATGNDDAEFIAFNSNNNFGNKSFNDFAVAINALKPSVMKNRLLTTFTNELAKSNKAKTFCFIMAQARFEWTPYVMNLNNPATLAKEETEVNALVADFYQACEDQLDNMSSLKSLTDAKKEFDHIATTLPELKQIHERLQTEINGIEDQITCYETSIAKMKDPIAKQFTLGQKLCTQISRPSDLLLELNAISDDAAATRNILLSQLAQIGSALTVDDAKSVSTQADLGLEKAKRCKTAFDAKHQELTHALTDGDKQIHMKRIEDLMRENLLRLRVALFDNVEFFHKTTTQFLCVGGVTASAPGKDGTKVPRGAAEMIAKLLECGDCSDISQIPLQQVIQTLTAIKAIANTALERGNTRLFKSVRKEPIQQFYTAVSAMKIHIPQLVDMDSQNFRALSLNDVNSKWPDEFNSAAFAQDNINKQNFSDSKASIASKTQLEQSASLAAYYEGFESSVNSSRSSRRSRRARAG